MSLLLQLTLSTTDKNRACMPTPSRMARAFVVSNALVEPAVTVQHRRASLVLLLYVNPTI
eukprot:5712765-Pleurochrysis_carterae.AAC.1